VEKPFFQLSSPDYPSIAAINEVIRSILSARRTSRRICRRRYLDTFDWRLYTAGYLFEDDREHGRHVLRLRPLGNDAPLIEEPASHVPRYAWEVGGGLRDILSGAIRNRALLELGALNAVIDRYETGNAAGNTPVLLEVEGLYPDTPGIRSQNILSSLDLRPVPGRAGEADHLVQALSGRYGFQPCGETLAHRVFGALQKSPADYFSRVYPAFDPAMPVHRALAMALLRNLDIMEKNIPGIEEELDIEFLHDFRVAGRRSRSLIKQVRDVFPESRLAAFSGVLSWLSAVTCAHRDLDVFLLAFDAGENKLCREYANELEPLRSFLERRRRKEHARLRRLLASKRFNRFRTNWRSYLETACGKAPRTAGAKAPVSEAAGRAVWRNYRRLMHQGCVIMTNYNFRSIHRLRKKGKQLRYLIETFRSLYAGDDLDKVIRALRKLQNNLGGIVDMHVQRALLSSFGKAKAPGKKVSGRTRIAVDRLIASTVKQEMQFREEFNGRFEKFSGASNQRRFRRLFHPANKQHCANGEK